MEYRLLSSAMSCAMLVATCAILFLTPDADANNQVVIKIKK